MRDIILDEQCSIARAFINHTTPTFAGAGRAFAMWSSDDAAPPRMYFIPFPTPGHALPMSDLARLFASRGADATLVLTHANAARLGGPVARAAASGLRIRVHAQIGRAHV